MPAKTANILLETCAMRDLARDLTTAAGKNRETQVQRLFDALRLLVSRSQGDETETARAGKNEPARRASRHDGGATVAELGHRLIDVRQVIAAGGEPLDEILDIARTTPVGGSFTVEAPFDPLPLRTMLNQMGFGDRAVEIAHGHWRVTFEHGAADAPSADGARVGLAEDGVRVDARGLDPARAMSEVLRLVDFCANVPRLGLHLDRDPGALIGELTARGWRCAAEPDMTQGVLVCLTRE